MQNYVLTIQLTKDSDITALNVAAGIAKGCGEIVYVKQGSKDLGFVCRDGTLGTAKPTGIDPMLKIQDVVYQMARHVLLVSDEAETAAAVTYAKSTSLGSWVVVERAKTLKDFLAQQSDGTHIFLHHFSQSTHPSISEIIYNAKMGGKVTIWHTPVYDTKLEQASSDSPKNDQEGF